MRPVKTCRALLFTALCTSATLLFKIGTAIGLLTLMLSGTTARAEVTFDWATVGNPDNEPDRLYTFDNPNKIRFGAVSYTYRISKYEVTNAQYVEFLNAVDPKGTNPNSVYHSSMGSDPRGGITLDSEMAHGSKYSARINMENKPVNYVSFFDSMRFVNWLENGQPTGGGGTESGVYTIGNGVDETRALGAKFFIPSEDEWYKAAFHQPATQGGDADNYWLYPTRSNKAPTIATANEVGDVSNPGANVANFSYGAEWNGQEGNVTTVGSAGPLSASFYGTFDQGGNVWEWNESVFRSAFRGRRGGNWDNGSGALVASNRISVDPSIGELGIIGFRVASLPVFACGDFDKDLDVDSADLVDFLAAWTGEGGTGATRDRGDCDVDGDVDSADMLTFLSNWTGSAESGRVASVPEPASGSIIGVAITGLLLAKRLRRA